VSEAGESGAAASSGGPAGDPVCKNCGEPVRRCAAFCDWGGWFHPDRLGEASDARYCAGSSGTLAGPAQPEGES
jgi:hypothetical protein